MRNFSRKNTQTLIICCSLNWHRSLSAASAQTNCVATQICTHTHAALCWTMLGLATMGIWVNINNRRRPEHTHWERRLSAHTIGKCVFVGGTLLAATCYHRGNGINMDAKPHRGAPKLTVDRRFDIKFFQQSLIRVTRQTQIHTKPFQKKTNRPLEKQSSSLSWYPQKYLKNKKIKKIPGCCPWCWTNF